MIFCEGDWTLVNDKWVQIWTTLNDYEFKTREGKVCEPNPDHILSNSEFFDQKYFLILD